MPNYFERDGDYQAVGGYGYGGGGFGGGAFGGCFAMIILVVVVLWLLFRQDRNDGYGNCGGGYNMPYPYPYPYPPYAFGSNCNSPLDCKIPMAPDMSNCEVDRDLWKVDADLLKCCCETKEVVHCENEKTRALIESNYVQDLRDKLAEKACEVQSLKTQAYTDAKFDALTSKLSYYDKENDKEYCKLNNKIDALMCEIPKRPPIWCEGITPNTHHTDCRHNDFPRRRHCDNDFNCDCN